MDGLTMQYGGGRPDTATASGFSLIELLVVIAIVGLLVATLMPALGAAQGSARNARCLANLRGCGQATAMYWLDHDNSFWPLRRTGQLDGASGVFHWFGFEDTGASGGSGTHRSLELSANVFSPYMSASVERLQCPDFPYGHADYYPKFDRRSASYGYNLHLSGGFMPTATPRTLSDLRGMGDEVVILADGVQYEPGNGAARFNEGHYLAYESDADPAFLFGWAHFRHAARANYLLLDGSATGQPLQGLLRGTYGGHDAGVLVGQQPGSAIYGF